ncbi:recombinase family protein [Streptomyces filamentosus]|uniref:recombinase family protein n=1 Tax=Streptomyces filamentosus TaxID=67294 RepID=UPI0036E7A026
MRAALYVRLSRETENSTSPERQCAACEALCAARGWQVMAVEEDIDVSGWRENSRMVDRGVLAGCPPSRSWLTAVNVRPHR